VQEQVNQSKNQKPREVDQVDQSKNQKPRDKKVVITTEPIEESINPGKYEGQNTVMDVFGREVLIGWCVMQGGELHRSMT
jgi:hypothetical protein